MIMNTDLMRHKSVLFLISLSQNKIQEIENKGVDYQLFMKTIRSYSHVEVHETISEELINSASLYEVVVIVGHQVNGCIEVADGSLFPMDNIVEALPSEFNGYLHVAICGSSIIWDAIKEHCPNSRIRASKGATQLELQLLIYSLLLSRTDLSKDTFDYCYVFERDYIKVLQKRKNSADLAKLPCATKLGNETIYVPRTVECEKKYPFHIFIHNDNEENEKREKEKIVNNTSARPVDFEKDVKEISFWITDLNLDDKIEVNLGFDTENVIIDGDNPQNYVWEEHQIHALFLATLKDIFSNDTFWCSINVTVNGRKKNI